MNLENPLKTNELLEKAIKVGAEELASKELLDKPEQRHIDKVSTMYKFMELFEPERFTKIIEMAAKGKDIKDEMGIELYTTLNQVMGDITNESQDKMNEAVKQIRETKIISNEELCNEIFKLQERFLIEKSSQVRSDPRIVSAFSGKEELLYKGIDFTISSMLELTRIYEGDQKLKILKKEEANNIIKKAVKFLCDINK